MSPSQILAKLATTFSAYPNGKTVINTTTSGYDLYKPCTDLLTDFPDAPSDLTGFTFKGVEIAYSPATGKAYRFSKSPSNVGWNLITPGTCHGMYTQLLVAKTMMRLHRIIGLVFLGLSTNQVIDHIRHADGTHAQDCLANLRIASRAENLQNSRKRKNNTTGYKGVQFHKRLSKYQASITIEHIRKNLGLFNTPEPAFIAYATASRLLHKEFSYVSPDEYTKAIAACTPEQIAHITETATHKAMELLARLGDSN